MRKKEKDETMRRRDVNGIDWGAARQSDSLSAMPFPLRFCASSLLQFNAKCRNVGAARAQVMCAPHIQSGTLK